MAKCKACGGSGKVKEDDKKGQELPKSPKSPHRDEKDWKRKPNDYNSPAIGSVRRPKTKGKAEPKKQPWDESNWKRIKKPQRDVSSMEKSKNPKANVMYHNSVKRQKKG